MTPEQLVAIVEKYEAELGKVVSPVRIASNTSGPLDALAFSHALWMCEQTKIFAATDMEKACRWLGFIQGVLWMGGLRTIDEMRDDNR